MKKVVLIYAVCLCMVTALPAGATEIQLSAECTWHAEAGCYAGCSNLFFYAECDADVNTTCDFSECSGVQINASCQGSCEASCTAAQCQVDAGTFDCEAYCSGDCQASCGAQCTASCQADCAGNDNAARCEASCEASCQTNCDVSCNADCQASCTASAPDIDCEGGCQASCQGSCQAQADIDCQIECESDAYLVCESELIANCNAYCDYEGYLECNGEFIDQSKFEAAVEWVKSHFSGTYSWDKKSWCDEDGCHAEAEVSASGEFHCATTAPGQRRSSRTEGLFKLIF